MPGPSEGNLGGANFELSASTDKFKSDLKDAEKASQQSASKIGANLRDVGKGPKARIDDAGPAADKAEAAAGRWLATLAGGAAKATGAIGALIAAIVGAAQGVDKLHEAYRSMFADVETRVDTLVGKFNSAYTTPLGRANALRASIEKTTDRIVELEYKLQHATSVYTSLPLSERLKNNQEELVVLQNQLAKARLADGEALREIVAINQKYTHQLKEQLSLLKQMQEEQQKTFGLDKIVFGPGNAGQTGSLADTNRLLNSILSRIP